MPGGRADITARSVAISCAALVIAAHASIQGAVSIEWAQLPSLPIPLANAAGARLGDTIYVAGGASEPGEQSALNRLFALAVKPLASARLPLPTPASAEIDALRAQLETLGFFDWMRGDPDESETILPHSTGPVSSRRSPAR